MKKKGVVADYLPWVLIAVAGLAVLIIAILVMKGKGFAIADQLKNLFKGGSAS